jgi:8-oxo-dGTP diphosphatase
MGAPVFDDAGERHVFGVPRPGERERPAAYALLRTSEGLAVVRGRDGSLFLPGGGLEAGESAEDAVLRELREECHIEAEVVARVAEAVQHFVAGDGTRYRSPMTFLECRLVTRDEGEGDHPLAWLSDRDDPDGFAHEAHAWAIREWRRRPPSQSEA